MVTKFFTVVRIVSLSATKRVEYFLTNSNIFHRSSCAGVPYHHGNACHHGSMSRSRRKMNPQRGSSVTISRVTSTRVTSLVRQQMNSSELSWAEAISLLVRDIGRFLAAKLVLYLPTFFKSKPISLVNFQYYVKVAVQAIHVICL